MKFISLFSGIGGFDLGFERAGMECVAQVEIDKSCVNVLHRHWKGVNKFEDVKECGHYNLPTADLICGGFPCQDLSIAGKRAGLDGERSGLWFEFHRIIAELKPEWVVIENVPGLLSSNEGRDFAIVIRGLVELGYGVSWRILDSQYFGVPQRRRRVFIVGSLGSGRSSEVLFESEGSSGDTSEGEEKGKDIAASIVSRIGKGGFTDPVNDNIIGALQARDYKGVGNQYVQENKLVAVGHSGGETLKLNEKANTLNAQSGSETTAMFNGVWEPRSQDGVPRIHDEVVPSLNTMQGGQRQPMVGVRRLTPTECERLQGFPDGWTEHQADTIRYRQLGNAVTVNVIGWIGKRIMDEQK
jgi:DNA (cytosine-5)-methyltransferase 1